MENGMRILVVEDEPMIAMALEDVLIGFGYQVVGPALRLDDALKLGREEPIDAAILDVNIAGERVYPVADLLTERSIPFVFVTGYGTSALRACDSGRPVMQKPYQIEGLKRILDRWSRH